MIYSGKKPYEIINGVIKRNNYTSYLEIGSGNGETGKLVEIDYKVGVDILPMDANSESCYNEFHETNSDSFFLSNRKKFDIIFIDGCNSYIQTMKDFLYSWATVSSNGCIVFNNCFPRCVQETEIGYHGEVYKALNSIDEANFRYSLVRNINGMFCVWKDSESRKIPNMANMLFEEHLEKFKI